MLTPKNIFVLTDIELVPDGDGEVVGPGLLGPVRQLYQVVEPGAGHLPDQLLAGPPRPLALRTSGAVHSSDAVCVAKLLRVEVAPLRAAHPPADWQLSGVA